jgi:hypothetical protein
MTAGRRTRTLLALAALFGSVAMVPASMSATASAVAPTSAARPAVAPRVIPGAVPRVVGCPGLCAGGEYHPIPQPVRIFDSRPLGVPNPAGPINDPGSRKPMGVVGGPSATFDVDLLGLATGPSFRNPWIAGTGIASATDVLAVVANVTLVQPSQAGFLTTFATGEAEPNASLLNFIGGRNVSNLGILRPNSAGKLTIALHGGPTGGSADVIIDVFGWISTSTYDVTAANSSFGARLVTIDPGRAADTRKVGGPVGTNASLHVPIWGATDINTGALLVPNDNTITGVVLNVTGVDPSASTFMSVVPADPGGVAPPTSNVNIRPSTIKANLVITPVNPTTGDIWIYNNSGATNIVVDIVGYLQPSSDETTRAGRIVPLSTPFRAFDTRSPLFGKAPLGPRQAEDWSFSAFSASVNIGGVSVGNQQALIGNLTNATLNRANPRVPTRSFLTVYPSPGGASTPPTVSNLNTADPTFGGALPVPNMAVVRYGANQVVRVFNSLGFADYLLDVSAVVLAD